MDKGTHSGPGERRGQVIRGTRFGAARAGAAAIVLPVVDGEAGWYHAVAIREAERAADVVPFPTPFKPH